MSAIPARLAKLAPAVLLGMRRGIEKESLRTDARGELAMSPHPVALGSALKHPHITTDFCESQLELITGVHGNPEACLDELEQIHAVVYRAIGEERLWVASMPCGLPPDETIPIGRYGSSNIGRIKSVYRMGLGHRYGRRMQTISGIHYNWSLPGVGTDAYFGLIRNFRRHSFLLLVLYGASPAVCPSFVAGREHRLQPFGARSLHLPHATSLRMGRLGYQSDAQSALAVSYNSLESYGASLQDAMTRPYPAYQAIGVRNPGGEYNQLSTALLQIENEFYGTIRPKRVIRPGERPLHALRERGVEYVEVRCMDLDPFEPVGIATATMRFLDVFLLHCLLADSPPDTPQEIAALGRNQQRAAERGREPGLRLERGDAEVALVDWAREVVGECRTIADALDAVHGGRQYAEAVEAAAARMADLAGTPSARVLATMAREFDHSYIAFVRAQGERIRNRFLQERLAPETAGRFARLAEESVQAQLRQEAGDMLPFDEFLRGYLAAERLVPQAKAA